MAKIAYIGVDGIARKVKQQYIGVDGIARKVKSGYIGVDGIARQCLSAGTEIGKLEVGSSVYLNVNGVPTEFIIVHQGIPDVTLYDSSCNGTWLLMKQIHDTRVWDSADNDYKNSDIHRYLNSTFLNLLDTDIKNIVKYVRIPYTDGTGEAGSYVTGSKGLYTRIFLLAMAELGYDPFMQSNDEGAALDYFNGASDSERRVEINGERICWWLRSPEVESNPTIQSAWAVGYTGSPTTINVTASWCVRPALIISNDTLVDSNFNVIA